MTRPGRRDVLLYGLWILLGGALGSTTCRAACLTDRDTPVDIVTPYHFAVPRVQVVMGLPPGTVIASVLIPEGRELARCGGEVNGGIWSTQGGSRHFTVAATNVPGVGMRVVSEKSGPYAGPSALPVWPWDAARPSPRMSQGGLRIELVKTGRIQPGVLTSVEGEVQYRVYSGHGAGARLVMRERLRYVGQLVIDVIGSGAVQGDQQLS